MKTSPSLGWAGKFKRNVAPAIPLKVFIGYADLPAVRRATSCIGETALLSGRNVAIQPLLWRAQQLLSSHWRDRSITAALEADIVVLTSSANEPTASGLNDWLRSFLKAARGRHVTLVMIAGADAWTISLEQGPKLATAAAQEAPPAVRQKLVA